MVPICSFWSKFIPSVRVYLLALLSESPAVRLINCHDGDVRYHHACEEDWRRIIEAGGCWTVVGAISD